MAEHSTRNTPANLLREDLALPAAVIYQSRMSHNLHWMQEFAQLHNVQLAPHGKTTMAPAFFQQQIAAGAWGITLANPQQAKVAASAGITRILMANQLVGRQNMQLVSELLGREEAVDFYCLVDSAANAHQLGLFFGERGQRLQLLLEIGVSGGRSGCRDRQQIAQVLEAVAQYPHLQLAGVETYEGLIHGENAQQRVREHLVRVRQICIELLHDNQFADDQVILTGAGSAWYDLVAEVFTDHNEPRLLPVIRPGCYLIHDRGIYQQAQDLVMARLESQHQNENLSNQNRCSPDGDLQSSLEIWAYVQSLPEPGSAILTLGKRDAAFDAGLPQPVLHFRPGLHQQPVNTPEDWKVTAIMDQHSMLQTPPDADLHVGDIIALSTSHPCLTFDKWRALQVIDDQYNVIDTVKTYF